MKNQNILRDLTFCHIICQAYHFFYANLSFLIKMGLLFLIWWVYYFLLFHYFLKMFFGCIFEYCGRHCISRYMCTSWLKKERRYTCQDLLVFFFFNPVILKTNFWKTYLLPASWRKFWNYYTEDWCSHWWKTRGGRIHDWLAKGCRAQRSHHKFHVFR